MGVVYNMVGGGGSGVVAFLIANYPSGATCTATCDGETLTGSGNTQSVFAIPFFGTWRVTITDQGQSAYKDVVVSDNLQYTVSLAFSLDLYVNGVIETAVSGGFEYHKINGSTGTFSITNANNILTFYDQFTSGTTATTVLFRTANKIDLESYNTLTLVVESLTTATQRPTVVGLFAADPSGETNTWASQAAALTSISVTSTQTTITLDISTVSRSNTYYVGCGLYGRSGSPATLTISAFYLS